MPVNKWRFKPRRGSRRTIGFLTSPPNSGDKYGSGNAVKSRAPLCVTCSWRSFPLKSRRNIARSGSYNGIRSRMRDRRTGHRRAGKFASSERKRERDRENRHARDDNTERDIRIQRERNSMDIEGTARYAISCAKARLNKGRLRCFGRFAAHHELSVTTRSRSRTDRQVRLALYCITLTTFPPGRNSTCGRYQLPPHVRARTILHRDKWPAKCVPGVLLTK